MSNVLSEEKRQQVIALGRLGWPLRRIEQETGVRRETARAPDTVCLGELLRRFGIWSVHLCKIEYRHLLVREIELISSNDEVTIGVVCQECRTPSYNFFFCKVVET